MRTLIIPAAGKGSRFFKEGFIEPKPLIRLFTGNVMVVEALKPFLPHVDRIILLLPESISAPQKTALETELRELLDHRDDVDVHVVLHCIFHQPLGAAFSVLSAQGLLEEDSEVVVLNSDQVFQEDAIDEWFARIDDSTGQGLFYDGHILTFEVEDPEDKRWSFVEKSPEDRHGYVTRVVEKQPVSSEATCGAYYFRSWKFLRQSILKSVTNPENKVNNEFYLAPVYNALIELLQPMLALRPVRIGTYCINQDQFHSLGTPALLKEWHTKFCPHVD